MCQIIVPIFSAERRCVSVAAEVRVLRDLGVTPGHLIGHRMLEAVAGRAGMLRETQLERVLRTGEVCICEQRTRTATGRYEHLTRMLPIWTVAGVSGVLVIMDQIEELGSSPGSNRQDVATPGSPALAG